TPDSIVKEMELTAEQIIDLKALMGDSSDNIPGVPGVGIKTATKLLKEYKTLDNIYENIDNITAKKLNENLRKYKEDAYLSYQLATIKRDTPIDISLEDVSYSGYNNDDVIKLFQTLEFRSLIERMGGEQKVEKEVNVPFEIIEKIESDHLVNGSILNVEMIDDNYHDAKIEAISLVNQKGNYVIHTEDALKSQMFIDWLEDEQEEKSIFDVKATTVALLNHDIQLKGVNFDLLLAAYIIDPAQKNEDIPSIARRLGHRYVQMDEEVYGKGAKRHVPEFEVIAEHVAKQGHALYELRDELIAGLKENEQNDLFMNRELRLAQVLAQMEHEGIKVDVNKLKEMDVEINGGIEVIEKRTHELAGEDFNVNSPKQLSVILFEKLELPVIKKTKTGYSTAADVLEKLEKEHDIIPEILMYRQLKKLHSTYIEGLLKVVYKDTNKIHTRFNQALTQTGRLSSTEPNMQNIPVRLEEGRKIRQAFIPSTEDAVIFAADYSQIELRVLAHISGDEKLSQAFKDDKDIHTQTAMDVFHVDKDTVDGQMRRQAKAVNFGIIYGISDYGLSQNLN